MRWSAADVRGTAASIAPWWALLTAGIQDLHPPREIASFLPDGASRGASPGAGDVEVALAALSRVARDLAERGLGMVPQTGAVKGLFLGDGGVPKQPAAAVRVDYTGITGDRQRTRKHHGRIWQALCLWSEEVIGDLQAEGHPIFGGACGENIVMGQIDWAAMRPGTRLRIGPVLAEVSVPALPCRQIKPFFIDARFSRVHHARHPGSSRWYATVLEPGSIAVGDVVEVEPRALAGDG
jgi:hypothetical protein